MNAKLFHACSSYCTGRAMQRLQSVLLILALSALMLLFSIATAPAQSLPGSDGVLLAQATPGQSGLDDRIADAREATSMATVATLPLMSDMRGSSSRGKVAMRSPSSSEPVLEVLRDCGGQGADAGHLSVIKPCESYWYGTSSAGPLKSALQSERDDIGLSQAAGSPRDLIPDEGSFGASPSENSERNSGVSSGRSSAAPMGRTEPVFWVLGAIAACGLGIAGLRGPWMGTGLTKSQRSWP
jgi:hypothetical protein